MNLELIAQLRVLGYQLQNLTTEPHPGLPAWDRTLAQVLDELKEAIDKIKESQ
jgi:hypothetical protein